MIRAKERAAAYRQMAQEKLQIETKLLSKLKKKTSALDRTTKKLDAFQQREASVRDLRRQLNDALVQVEESSSGNLRAEERWVLVMM